MSEQLISDLKKRMDGAIESLSRDFSGLRTGRASTSLLEPLMVDCYGSKMPMSQVGTISTPEARLISVQVWDQSMVAIVEKAIRESDLGLNPSSEGNVIRVPLPELSQERRIELTKVAKKYAEQSRIAIRNVRRDGMETLKKQEKDGDISEDEQHRFSDKIQELTDDFIKTIDQTLSDKEADILQV
ncbi:MAG: ribosome recycling factor [Alphaproteobacteria bacterium]